MEKILVSACLLGSPVRYDGKARICDHPVLKAWQEQGRIVPVCPELEGGLPVPRPAAELKIIEDSIKVITVTGEDVTQPFEQGANKALSICLGQNIRVAILTEGSPSCGSSDVYDGSFTGHKVPGLGITSSALQQRGVRVFSQLEIDEAIRYLEQLDSN